MFSTKPVFTLLVLVLFTTGLMAQNEKGFRLGYQTAWQVGDNSSDGTLHNFYAGFFHVNKLAPTIGFEKGVEYFQTGFMTNDETFRRIHTISVPLKMRVKIGPAYASAGLAGNFKIGETYEVGGVDIKKGNEAAFFDLPVLVGAGFKIAFVAIEARYGYGLLSVNDGVNNSYLQLGLSFSLKSKKSGN